VRVEEGTGVCVRERLDKSGHTLKVKNMSWSFVVDRFFDLSALQKRGAAESFWFFRLWHPANHGVRIRPRH
jgi:hypothetical protein